MASVARWVGGWRWRLSRRRQSSKGCGLIISLLSLFIFGKKFSFFKVRFLVFLYRWGMLAAEREHP